MRPLHVANELRLGHVLGQIAGRFGRPVGALRGPRTVNSRLRRRPDARTAGRPRRPGGRWRCRRENIAAPPHASAGGAPIDDRHGEPQAALHDGESFDVLLLLEVVEHVDDAPAFVRDAVAHLAPGALLPASTITRTVRSDLAAIVGAERVFRFLPRGSSQTAGPSCSACSVRSSSSRICCGPSM